MLATTAIRAAWRRVRPGIPALLLAPAALIVAQADAQNRPANVSEMGPPAPPADQGPPERLSSSRFNVKTTIVPLTATMTPAFGTRGNGDGGGIAGTCPPVATTYTNPVNFTGPAVMNLQAGMVETEIGAVTYVLPPESFPVIIRTVEAVWARAQSGVQQTTNYSIMFWSGPPTSGAADVVYSSSTEPGDPPPIVIFPGQQAAGVNVQITIDPGDPDQIVIEDDGSHSFTVGWRVDDHNNPPTAQCTCFGGLGTLPAFCCPPNPSQNTFLTTDTDGHPAGAEQNNWLWARPCPGGSAFCFSTGWFNFTVTGTPSGDWVMRTTYEPFGCGVATGACCINNGTQCVGPISAADCAAVGGFYRGDNTNCDTPCPEPTGACCVNSGSGCTVVTAAQCAAASGTFRGAGTTCADCAGACCIPSNSSCQTVTQFQCSFAPGSTFQGFGTSCATFVCFPMGACCLENGTCNAGPMSPAACQALGGTFAGHNSTCGSANCQLPTGACCFGGTNCAEGLTQAACTGLGGTWAYPATTCQAFVCPYCPQDIERDGAVNINDLLAVINNWGPCNNCAADIDPAPFGDNQVSINDLLSVINNWGLCP